LEGETFFSNTGMLKMLSDTVTIERNKTAIRNLLSEAINTGRLELCDRYLAAERVDHQDYGLPAGAADGHEGFKRVLGVFRDAFPDLMLTIDFIVADREKASRLRHHRGHAPWPVHGRLGHRKALQGQRRGHLRLQRRGPGLRPLGRL
jgi:hypothetical protein